MKKKYWSLYYIVEHNNFELKLVEMGFASEAAALEALQKLGGGRFMIFDYYE